MIFAGPTPDVPGEDAREWAFREARDAFDATKQQSEAESQVVKFLEDANKFMQQAVQQLAEAVDHSTLVIFGRRTSKDMGNRDALNRAQNAMDNIHRLVAQAQRLLPDIQSLGRINFAEEYTVVSTSLIMSSPVDVELNLRCTQSDDFIDDIFSDVAMRDKILRTQSQCKKAAKKLQGLVVSAKERWEQSRLEADQASERLVSCRRELQQFRQESFAGAAQLPSYEESIAFEQDA